jgi:small subunit ribosomal protein S6
MRDYEMMVILHPELDAAGIKGTMEAIAARIGRDGEVTRMDLLGRRKLAYVVRKVQQGTYVLYNFTAPPAAIDPLKQFLRVEQHETVIRYLILIDEKRGIRPPAQPLPEIEEAEAEEPVEETIEVVLEAEAEAGAEG